MITNVLPRFFVNHSVVELLVTTADRHIQQSIAIKLYTATLYAN